ncbi:MAG: sulfur reduction protein DsrE, partial [Acidimicrobiia bacterium]|nr:sulfur reduction protein DsrE [Acidimicrobiia bacterium]
MKVAYILNTPRAASYKVAQMILPQLEAGTHGVEVVGIFFFDDNVWALRKGDPIGERLAAVANETGMLIMACDN